MGGSLFLLAASGTGAAVARFFVIRLLLRDRECLVVSPPPVDSAVEVSLPEEPLSLAASSSRFRCWMARACALSTRRGSHLTHAYLSGMCSRSSPMQSTCCQEEQMSQQIM